MSTRIIDGKAVAASVCDQVQQDVLSLAAQGVTPGLAVVLVGEDPASAVYVRNKAAACKAVGVHSEQIKLPASVSQTELLEHIQRLNANQNIHGILVQLPLPQHIDAQAVISTIAPHKDVDGFHLMNAGALMTGLPGFWPCTPHGCLKLLDSIDFDLRGKHAVVVGRSNIVGKPMAMMLLARNATVTICHSASRDLPDLTRQADVLVAAVGKPRYIRADMLQPGVVVLDVGINRLPDGKLCGDVDFDEVAQGVASAITPVPGGVGPMTIAMLLVNTLEAAQKSLI